MLQINSKMFANKTKQSVTSTIRTQNGLLTSVLWIRFAPPGVGSGYPGEQAVRQAAGVCDP